MHEARAAAAYLGCDFFSLVDREDRESWVRAAYLSKHGEGEAIELLKQFKEQDARVRGGN